MVVSQNGATPSHHPAIGGTPSFGNLQVCRKWQMGAPRMSFGAIAVLKNHETMRDTCALNDSLHMFNSHDSLRPSKKCQLSTEVWILGELQGRTHELEPQSKSVTSYWMWPSLLTS